MLKKWINLPGIKKKYIQRLNAWNNHEYWYIPPWQTTSRLCYVTQLYPPRVICTARFNPLHAKFFRGNKTIYLHFMSFPSIDITQVVEILPQVRQVLTHSTQSISGVLVSWWCKVPGHQQSWQWLCWTAIIWSLYVKGLYQGIEDNFFNTRSAMRFQEISLWPLWITPTQQLEKCSTKSLKATENMKTAFNSVVIYYCLLMA